MKFSFSNMFFVKKFSAATLLLVFSLTAHNSVQANAINLVKNGSFELSNGSGQLGYNGLVLNDWTSSGYNFLFNAGTGDTTGAQNSTGQSLTLWGSNNGGVNPLASSGNGGNFIANDGAYFQGALEQTIFGLTIGKSYDVHFEWAAAQQYGFDGSTTEWWRVNLGSNWMTTQATGIYSNASHGSSNWMQETMRFTATSTSEVLSFLAVGTPEGKPPFSLLDGVSMTETVELPEPSSLLMLLIGLCVLGFSMARRRSSVN